MAKSLILCSPSWRDIKRVPGSQTRDCAMCPEQVIASPTSLQMEKEGDIIVCLDCGTKQKFVVLTPTAEQAAEVEASGRKMPTKLDMMDYLERWKRRS